MDRPRPTTWSLTTGTPAKSSQFWSPTLNLSGMNFKAAKAIFQEGDPLYQKRMILPLRLGKLRGLSRRSLTQGTQLMLEPIDSLVGPGIEALLEG